MYKIGTIIQFLDEPCESIPYSMESIVDKVDQYCLIHVIWNDGIEMILKDVKDCFQKLEIRTLKYKVPLTIDISEELDEQEVEILEQEIEGQLSDGWGEGFEQVPILQGHQEYYVSFFSFEPDWKLTKINSETQNELSMSMDMMRGV